MKKLYLKNINQAIKIAQNNVYFDRLSKIYDTLPTGRCFGCTKCCMESVHTHFIEFLNIFHYLRENRQLYEKIFPQIIQYYFLEMVKKEHCPFLDEEGRCTIYEVRPLVCRMFGHLTEKEYEESYKNVLHQNIEIMKVFKNKYKIMLPENVVNYKIDYCRNFEVDKQMTKDQRQTLIDQMFTMESAFFMRGLITEDFIDTGLVSWFVYTVFDIEEAGDLRVKIMKEYLESGYSESLEEIMKKIKVCF
ncbi:YkgJ family cysteine cluster protein [Crassaminicella profunda]|uniref:YkgJ family cysteine cluster protein n=1 Tax=Crassaminicella profunda TaxID=1286698 RepID=UPI001CA6B62D|nr:YkgJ family cysteine cluster protein [Crassaminicella profunda]QZY55446.1 YkgJ family cysteine cluster protein [Crassaminicella profunda]